MKRTIYHLTFKTSGEHKYYGSLAAVFLDNKDLGVSKFTLDRWDWSVDFENDKIILRKSVMLSTHDVRGAAK